MRQRRNAARRARRRLHVRNTDAPQLLQALVHCGAVTLGKHMIDSTLGRAYKQLPMYEEFLVELKRIADALEALALRPPVSLVSPVTTPQEQQEQSDHPQRH